MNTAFSNFGLTKTPDSLGEEELVGHLAARIAEMLETESELLMSTLYRLDVDETKIRQAMSLHAPEPAPLGLARLVFERQQQRLQTKRSVKVAPLSDWKDWEW